MCGRNKKDEHTELQGIPHNIFTVILRIFFKLRTDHKMFILSLISSNDPQSSHHFIWIPLHPSGIAQNRKAPLVADTLFFW